MKNSTTMIIAPKSKKHCNRLRFHSCILKILFQFCQIIHLTLSDPGKVLQDPPLSKSIANVLWTEISTSTPDGFSSWRYWYCLQKSVFSFIINSLKIFPFFNNFSLKMTAKICFTILQSQKHLRDLNPGLPGGRPMSYN